MTEKKYPGIYPHEISQEGKDRACVSKHFLEAVYDLGFEHGKEMPKENPLAGWSNLTAAISSGERIDWERLEGVEAKCVHPELGALARNLARRKGFSEETANGWCQFGENTVWEVALPSGWYGLHGWSLYIKGDVPLRKQTADDLEPGTIFEAVLTDEEEFGPATLLRVDAGIIDVGDWQMLDVDLTCIEVSRVLGTFQTPGEDA